MEIYTGESIAEVLTDWGCDCFFVEHKIAPQLVKYFFKLKNLLHLQRVKKLTDNLSALMGGLNIYFSTLTQNAHFSLAIQRLDKQIIYLKNYASDVRSAKPLSAMIGVDENNNSQLLRLNDMPHTIIGGQTGGGKSVLLNTIITSLCCYNSTGSLGMILIDPKRLEFSIYNNLPHLVVPVATEISEIENILNWLVVEMEERYKQLSSAGLSQNDGRFKHLCIVIDELADLVLSDNNTIKPTLVRLLQKSRACGMTFILATQSVRAKVLDGNMLANCPTRIALTCASARESVLILGKGGAEKLQGRGDAILQTIQGQEIRLQVPYISKDEIKKLIVAR